MVYDLSPLIPELWQPKIQDRLDNELVAKPLTNTRVFPAGSKKKGDTIHRPYSGADPDVVDYTPRTNVPATDIQYFDDVLLLDQRKATQITPVDPLEDVQALRDVVSDAIEAHARALNQYIDKDILNQMALDAADTFDDSLFGGTAGSPIALANITAANMEKLVIEFKNKMRKNNARVSKGLFLVLPTKAIGAIEQNLIQNGFQVADMTLESGWREYKVGQNGYQGTFLGVRIFFSNNLAVDNATTPTEMYAVGGVVGAMDLAIQDEVTVHRREAAQNASYNFFATVLYGRSTPNNYKKELVKIVFDPNA